MPLPTSVLTPPNWLLQAQVNEQVFLVKEGFHAHVVKPLEMQSEEPTRGRRILYPTFLPPMGSILLKFPDGQVQRWTVDANGRGFDGMPCILPSEEEVTMLMVSRMWDLIAEVAERLDRRLDVLAAHMAGHDHQHAENSRALREGLEGIAMRPSATVTIGEREEEPYPFEDAPPMDVIGGDASESTDPNEGVDPDSLISLWSDVPPIAQRGQVMFPDGSVADIVAAREAVHSDFRSSRPFLINQPREPEPPVANRFERLDKD